MSLSVEVKMKVAIFIFICFASIGLSALFGFSENAGLFGCILSSGSYILMQGEGK